MEEGGKQETTRSTTIQVPSKLPKTTHRLSTKLINPTSHADLTKWHANLQSVTETIFPLRKKVCLFFCVDRNYTVPFIPVVSIV